MSIPQMVIKLTCMRSQISSNTPLALMRTRKSLGPTTTRSTNKRISCAFEGNEKRSNTVAAYLGAVSVSQFLKIRC